MNNKNSIVNKVIFSEIKTLIEESKQQVAIAVNSTMTKLYWYIGKRIKDEILQNNRAEYGKNIVVTLSSQLTAEYGSGWSKRHLHHCIRFVEVFPDFEIVNTLCTQLSWSHIRLIIPIKEPVKRDFYIEMCKHEKWSVRTFQERINSMLFERTAISRKPDLTIKNEIETLKNSCRITPDLVFKDPYFLDFLDLNDSYSENDLESSILAELQRFIIELGTDFAFLARQKRITVDNEDYYIDLLFFHRRLKRLIAIDLKLGKFKAAHKGQMELYLRYLEKHEMTDGENSPLGLILCAAKNEEHVELMQLDKSNIKIAEYLTKLPDIKLLEQKLHQSVERAKNRLAQKETDKD